MPSSCPLPPPPAPEGDADDRDVVRTAQTPLHTASTSTRRDAVDALFHQTLTDVAAARARLLHARNLATARQLGVR